MEESRLRSVANRQLGKIRVGHVSTRDRDTHDIRRAPADARTAYSRAPLKCYLGG